MQVTCIMCKEICCLTEKNCMDSCSHHKSYLEPEETLLSYQEVFEDFNKESEIEELDLIHYEQQHAGCNHDHAASELHPMLGLHEEDSHSDHRHCKDCNEHIDGDGIICKNCGRINLWT